MTRYQFQIDDEKWEGWKMTVPRDKSLETRIIELIEADAEGRVFEENELEKVHNDLEQALEDEDWATVAEIASQFESD